ncbi:MAG TPA: hypothetical protein VK681_26045 [Reyranella sp.]|nr:hypothetical protein [Reyranella sp.]
MNKDSHHGAMRKPAVQRRNWKHVHHSPIFWVAVVLFLAAITIYVLSDDLSWRPQPR